MKSYRDLEIYKESKRLGIEIHRMTMGLPKFELFEEGSQIRRSAKSVTSMIEGYGRRRYKADFIKHLTYSHAECDETIVHLDFLFETGSLKDENLYTSFKMHYENLSRKLNSYITWVENNWNDFPTSNNL